MAAVLALAGTAGAAPATLSEAESTALYTAADYIVRGGIAMGCNSGNPLAPASRFAFETADLAGDGSTQMLLIEFNPVCFGREGQAFSVMVRTADGSWRKAGGASGVAVPVDTRSNGWRDIEYGSAKLPRPLLHWNGHDYR
jgi:hypothetical protein